MRSLGERAYLGYCTESRGVSLVTGQILPLWKDLNVAIKLAWEKAARAVLCEPKRIDEFMKAIWDNVLMTLDVGEPADLEGCVSMGDPRGEYTLLYCNIEFPGEGHARLEIMIFNEDDWHATYASYDQMGTEYQIEKIWSRDPTVINTFTLKTQ